MTLSFENLDAANRAHAKGTGVIRPRSDWPWFVVSALAAIAFGAFVVWLVLPGEAWPW